MTAARAFALAALAACGGAEAGSDAEFVGATVCGSCHERELALWSASHHRMAMQPADSSAVLGDFTGASSGSGAGRATFLEQGGRFIVRTLGADSSEHDYEVGYTFGVSPLQQYLLALPRGRYQAFTTAWDTRPRDEGGQRWFQLYADSGAGRGDALHWTGAAHNWNYMCAECHSTGVRRNYVSAGDSYSTDWAEVNVACEACHGPGSRHAEWAGDSVARSRWGRPAGLSVSLGDAGEWERAAGAATASRTTPTPGFRAEVEMCGRCHSRRTWLWPEYRHGRPLAESHRVELLAEGLYEPDGQQLDEVYEYGSFLQSRMYAAGVTCSNCHDPHSGMLVREGNSLCTNCHDPAAFDDADHHRHAPGTAAARCVSCHMPERTYMRIDARRDHRFHVPRPDESVRYGTPNACSTCHADRGAAWAARAVDDWRKPSANARTSFTANARTSFTAALALGRAGRVEAFDSLKRIVADQRHAAIVRATALTLLGSYPSALTTEAAAGAARDADPLVRRAAASVLPSLGEQQRVAIGAGLLADSVRTVRLEAVVPMAALPPTIRPGAIAGALERAIAEFREAQAFNADRAEANTNLGTLEALLGQSASAQRAFEAAIVRDPRFAPAYVGLADLARAAGREPEAERVLRRGLAEAPDAAVLHHALGLSLVRQKRLAESLPALAQAAALAPGSARYAYVHAVALHDSGDSAAALRVLDAAASRFPSDASIRRALAAYRRR